MLINILLSTSSTNSKSKARLAEAVRLQEQQFTLGQLVSVMKTNHFHHFYQHQFSTFVRESEVGTPEHDKAFLDCLLSLHSLLQTHPEYVVKLPTTKESIPTKLGIREGIKYVDGHQTTVEQTTVK